ncbi:hypothetical protein [Bdellovibrio sp. HCB2-146]|uniref:hypothetical protein n=1 Tax=Bdellovibrio sp. HCB2-146 TaxID=3394362 RepID=UPI0039BC6DE0
MQARFNIAVARFFICIYLLIFHSDFPDISYNVANFVPQGLFHLLPGPIGEFWFLPLRILWMVSLFLAAFGRLMPVSMGAALLSGTYVMAYCNNFGLPIVGTALAYLCLWILFLSEFGRDQKKNFLKLAQVIIVMFYCVSGLQKLRFGGLEWVTSENLAIQMFYNRMTPTAQWLLSLDPIWIRMLAGSIVTIEILSPLALINKRIALVFVFLWASMHIGIQVVFDYHRTFLSCIPCLAFFIDWDRVVPQRLKGIFK